MLYSTKKLTGYRIQAEDGEIGKVRGFYFNDEKWIIRYLVVNTRPWLPGRQVLISPASIRGKLDLDLPVFPVNLSKEEVKKSPGSDTERPVSRQKEALLDKYFGWPLFWRRRDKEEIKPAISSNGKIFQKGGDPRLRSTKIVIGYRIHASDGEIGYVKDFIIDDETWSIRYMVVGTRKWLPGRKVLVAPVWIDSVNWAERKVGVDLTTEAVKNSPEYDRSAPVNREYETRLYDYYGRPKYWE